MQSFQKNHKFIFFILFLIFINLGAHGLWYLVQNKKYLWTSRDYIDIYFLDVGQGDATLITTDQGKNILIDGGRDLSVIYQLGKVLPFYERTIDLLILTHPDQDHLLGLIGVLERFQVEHIIYTGVEEESAAYQYFLELIKKEKAQVTLAQAGQEFYYDQTRLLFFYPQTSIAGKKIQDSNAGSIAGQVSFGQSDFLFTGDLPISQELELLSAGIKVQSEIMKAGHHGSKHSSHFEFLQAIGPQEVIISAGRENSYGHPHFRVLKNIEKIGAKILRTDTSGTIHRRLFGQRIE